MEASMSKKDSILYLESHARVPTKQYLAFSRPYISDHCPRCNNLETTIHILRYYPWAKEVWCDSPGVLPLTFFQLPLQSWL